MHVILYFTFIHLISYHFQSSCEEILNKGQRFKWSEPTIQRLMCEQLRESMYNLSSFSSNLNMELGLNMQQKKKKVVSSSWHMARDTKSTQTLGDLLLIQIVYIS